MQPPFYDKNKDKLYKKIIFNEPDFTKNLSVKPSSDAKDLILRLLDKNQKNRIKIGQVKTHKFFDGINFQDRYDGKIIASFIPDKETNKYVDPILLNEKSED
jgi:serine/threonine protein kinase